MSESETETRPRRGKQAEASIFDQLPNMEVDDLVALKTAIDKILEPKMEEARQRAIEEARARFAALGIPMNALMPSEPPRARKAKGPARQKASSEKAPATHRHPDGMEYRVGQRGQTPKWFSDATEEERERYRIKE